MQGLPAAWSADGDARLPLMHFVAEELPRVYALPATVRLRSFAGGRDVIVDDDDAARCAATMTSSSSSNNNNNTHGRRMRGEACCQAAQQQHILLQQQHRCVSTPHERDYFVHRPRRFDGLHSHRSVLCTLTSAQPALVCRVTSSSNSNSNMCALSTSGAANDVAAVHVPLLRVLDDDTFAQAHRRHATYCWLLQQLKEQQQQQQQQSALVSHVDDDAAVSGNASNKRHRADERGDGAHSSHARVRGGKPTSTSAAHHVDTSQHNNNNILCTMSLSSSSDVATRVLARFALDRRLHAPPSQASLVTALRLLACAHGGRTPPYEAVLDLCEDAVVDAAAAAAVASTTASSSSSLPASHDHCLLASSVLTCIVQALTQHATGAGTTASATAAAAALRDGATWLQPHLHVHVLRAARLLFALCDGNHDQQHHHHYSSSSNNDDTSNETFVDGVSSNTWQQLCDALACVAQQQCARTPLSRQPRHHRHHHCSSRNSKDSDSDDDSDGGDDDDDLVELFERALHTLRRGSTALSESLLVAFGRCLLARGRPLRAVVCLVQDELLSGRNRGECGDVAMRQHVSAFLSDMLVALCSNNNNSSNNSSSSNMQDDSCAQGAATVVTRTTAATRTLRDVQLLTFAGDVVKYAYARRLRLTRQAFDAVIGFFATHGAVVRACVLVCVMCVLGDAPTATSLLRVAWLAQTHVCCAQTLRTRLRAPLYAFYVWCVQRHGATLLVYDAASAHTTTATIRPQQQQQQRNNSSSSNDSVCATEAMSHALCAYFADAFVMGNSNDDHDNMTSAEDGRNNNNNNNNKNNNSNKHVSLRSGNIAAAMSDDDDDDDGGDNNVVIDSNDTPFAHVARLVALLLRLRADSTALGDGNKQCSNSNSSSTCHTARGGAHKHAHKAACGVCLVATFVSALLSHTRRRGWATRRLACTIRTGSSSNSNNTTAAVVVAVVAMCDAQCTHALLHTTPHSVDVCSSSALCSTSRREQPERHHSTVTTTTATTAETRTTMTVFTNLPTDGEALRTRACVSPHLQRTYYDKSTATAPSPSPSLHVAATASLTAHSAPSRATAPAVAPVAGDMVDVALRCLLSRAETHCSVLDASLLNALAAQPSAHDSFVRMMQNYTRRNKTSSNNNSSSNVAAAEGANAVALLPLHVLCADSRLDGAARRLVRRWQMQYAHEWFVLLPLSVSLCMHTADDASVVDDDDDDGAASAQQRQPQQDDGDSDDDAFVACCELFARVRRSGHRRVGYVVGDRDTAARATRRGVQPVIVLDDLLHRLATTTATARGGDSSNSTRNTTAA